MARQLVTFDRDLYLARIRARLRGEPEPNELPIASTPTELVSVGASGPSSPVDPLLVVGEPEVDPHEALGRLVAELDADEARAVVGYARSLLDARTR